MLEFDDIQHILLTHMPALTGRYEFLSFRSAVGARAWLATILEDDTIAQRGRTESRYAPTSTRSPDLSGLCRTVSLPAPRGPAVLGRQGRASGLRPGGTLPLGGGVASVPRPCVDRSTGAAACMVRIPGAAAGILSAGAAAPLGLQRSARRQSTRGHHEIESAHERRMMLRE